MDNFFIRPANTNDVKSLAEVEKACFSLPWSEQSFFEEITGNKAAYYFVAEISGRLAGYAGMWMILDEGHIINVAVLPEFRRQGIAKALMHALIKTTDKRLNAYTLEVRVSNQNAISLYKSFDFKECGIRKKYYEDNNEDAIIMWRRISVWITDFE